MRIYYLSITGNIRRFIEKLGNDYSCVSILDHKEDIVPGAVFVMPTIGFGGAPAQAVEFLTKHKESISYLIGSGNKNWGAAYCGGVEKLSQEFGIPILMKFELQGTNETVTLFREKIDALS